ncbi:putative cytochrome P450 oxidoreductase [Mytilinidion resinicola]|uniref:Cytochrome P450 oxidoreductase n=1 Tax=Mytilinidion resinicola TaxID=574789 RepID=A0A6A6Z1L2_9PEZI|nr:putative cytochrome P450 oxidoreductase [Mytilinidion resinicola]KAF2814065.1 putative cytochrome P450 oxidoreductase [Mytilinidion resinicola]
MSFPIYIVLLLLAYPAYRLFRTGKRHPRMPPGPPTVPILGNALQIPKTGLGKMFKVWADMYGPIFSLTIGPTNIVVLTDRKAVNYLLDKKGSIYSDRPFNYVTNYITHGDHLTLEKQGASWREKRMVTTRNLNPKMLDEKHWKIQEAEAVVFMNNILRDPARIFDYAKLYTLSVASTLIYGQRVASLDSYWFKGFFELMEMWLAIQEPGATPPIDEFPFLKYLPGQWKKKADECRSMMDDMWDKARRVVDERRALGDKRDCFIDSKIEEYTEKGFPMSQHAFNNLFGELLEAGADTTANQILTLILAFAKYPEIQRRAKAEIDAVCGTERAPLFSDFENLPYINCIIKEGMRWRPTATTGLPHMCIQDDEYEGMFIPKGSMVFCGIWAMNHDASRFPNPDKFDPDRYLNHPKLANEYAVSPDYNNRDHYGYGAGRRQCPGMHLAERNMWRIASKLLWAFDISEVDNPITGQVEHLDENAFTSAILLCPLPFTVKVVPRSKKHLARIEQELESAEAFLAAWKPAPA